MKSRYILQIKIARQQKAPTLTKALGWSSGYIYLFLYPPLLLLYPDNIDE
jgi:hypothetical protein